MYYVSGAVLGARDIVVSITDKAPALLWAASGKWDEATAERLQ